MCGLFGILSFDNLNFGDKRKVFWEGLYISALRGTDGTGLAFIEKPGSKPVIYKRALPSWDFLQLKIVDKLMMGVEKHTLALGHTRSSTRGQSNDDNAHPFVHGPITLIHNGHISNHHTLTKHNFEVDSEAMCYAMSETTDMKALLEKITGEYCLIWHDKDKQTFNIARNDGRPLSWVYTTIGMVFASEAGMLTGILRRANLKIKDNLWYPEKHVWYSWDLTKGKVEEYSAVPFVPCLRSMAGADLGEGTTVLSGRGTHKRTKGLSAGSEGNNNVAAALFQSRDVMTKQRLKYKPTTPKQENRAVRRLAKYHLNPITRYTFDQACYIPYKGIGDADKGFVYGSGVQSKSKVSGVVIHNFTRSMFVELKKDMADGEYFFFKPIDTYGVLNGGTVVIGEIDNLFLIDRGSVDVGDSDDEDQFDTVIEGPNHELITIAEWKKVTEGGCALCQGACNPDFADKMVWLGEYDNEPVCHECAEDPKNKEFILGACRDVGT
jgi:predicted glutamine amidotransferase